jgi:hypothetical protein
MPLRMRLLPGGMGWGIVETKDENVVSTVEVVTSEYADHIVSSNWAGPTRASLISAGES